MPEDELQPPTNIKEVGVHMFYLRRDLSKLTEALSVAVAKFTENAVPRKEFDDYKTEQTLELVDIKESQKEILHRLDNLSVVSVERWEKHNAKVDARFNAHGLRIEALEDINKLRDSSIWTKIGRAFEKNLVNYIGAGILIFAISVAYIYLRNDLEQSKAPIINTKE